MNFFFRQPVYCMKSPRKAWATRKAMKQHAIDFPACAFTGRSPIHVHHIEPIRYAPHRAADPTNFISLAAKDVHRIVGHAGNWKQYVENVESICKSARIGREKQDLLPNVTGEAEQKRN